MYIGLVVKLVDRVSSLLVAKVLAPIIVKLLEAMRGFPKLVIKPVIVKTDICRIAIKKATKFMVLLNCHKILKL